MKCFGRHGGRINTQQQFYDYSFDNYHASGSEGSTIPIIPAGSVPEEAIDKQRCKSSCQLNQMAMPVFCGLYTKFFGKHGWHINT